MFNFVGTAIGFFIPSLFVNRESKQEIANLMIAQAGICVIMCGIVTCLFKKKPEFPPSVSASQERELFWPAFKKVFQNRDYLLLVLAFSMSNGTLNVLATLIDLISKPYGFSTFDNSVFGTLLIASGIIGAVVLGGIVTVLKKYKKVCIFTCLGALVSLLLFIYTLEEKSMIITCFSISLLGLVLTPLQPISYEFGIELTYPIGEAMTGGILVCAGQIIGIIQIGLSYALQNQPIIIGFICMAGLGLGGIALAFARENLQRALIDHNSSLFISLQPNP